MKTEGALRSPPDTEARPKNQIPGSIAEVRVFGVPVRLHFTFVLLLAFLVFIGVGARQSHLMYVLYILALFASVLLHELGHAIVSRRYGIRTIEIVMFPIGGVARLERNPKPREELWIALAGPAVNFAIAGALFGLLASRGELVPLGELAKPSDANLWMRIGAGNLILAVFNLLPAFPMDGGRILRALLGLRKPEEEATRIAAGAGRFFAVAMGLFGLLSMNFILLFIAFFVYLGAAQEGMAAAGKVLMKGVPVRAAMVTDFRTLSHGDSIPRRRPAALHHPAGFPRLTRRPGLGTAYPHGPASRHGSGRSRYLRRERNGPRLRQSAAGHGLDGGPTLDGQARLLRACDGGRPAPRPAHRGERRRIPGPPARGTQAVKGCGRRTILRRSVGKFFIRNFGCRATQADGAALGSALERSGFEESGDCAQADLVILNTCTVTTSADQDVRQAVRRVRRDNPEARILVTGCYAQRAPGEVAAMPGVTWVVGNSHKTKIPDILAAAPAAAPYHGQIFVGDIFAQQEFLAAPVEDAGGDRTRPNLKIQDGCSNRCSFCIIPFVRGKSRSAPPEQVVEQVRSLGERYREIVLSGINLGRWGREPGSRMRLADLLRRLLAETGVERLRLSSIEPMDFSDDLLGLMAESPRIARHVHAPLQTGCDSVLRRMRRKYHPRHYEDRVRKARAWMPDAAIGADVMVGFPGETDGEFEENRAFIESLPFTYLHVFTYSERPGTPAASMAAQVPIHLRKERNRVLRELAARKNVEFRRSMIGRRLSVVTLEQAGAALSSNYLSIELASPSQPNRIVEVEIGAVTATGLRAVG